MRVPKGENTNDQITQEHFQKRQDLYGKKHPPGLKKQEKSHGDDPTTLPVREPGKEEQTRPQTSRKEGRTVIRAEINEVETNNQNRSMEPGAG